MGRTPEGDFLYLARVRRYDEITGLRVSLELIRDDDMVDMSASGDEFISVSLRTDPYLEGP